MPPTDVSAATNARMVTRVEYGIDPRGWRLAARLNSRFQRTNAGLDGVRVGPVNAFFTGVAPSPHNFAGLAGLGLGGSRPVVSRTTRLDNAQSAAVASDPGLAVFAARSRRQR